MTDKPAAPGTSSPGTPSGPPTTPAALVARAAAIGAPITAEQAGQMLRYLDVILEINRGINLTAVRDREDGVLRHILDSLSVVPLWKELAGTAAPKTMLDLGTGGGFPGAILAAAWPDTKALLIDGTGKKVRAVSDALEAAGISNAEADQVKGSQLPSIDPDTRFAFELATARAVAPAGEIVAELKGLVASRGFVFAMKGPEPPADEVAQGEISARQHGFNPLAARRIQVPGLERRTVLVYRRRA